MTILDSVSRLSPVLFLFAAGLPDSSSAQRRQPPPLSDGVVSINQAAALRGGVTPGDTRGFPVTLKVSGSYRLTGNLVDDDFAGPVIIEITADRVALDLNGFEVSSPSFARTIFGSNSEVSVTNGRIRGRGGIELGRASSVDRIHVSGVGDHGEDAALRLGDDCRMTNSAVTHNFDTDGVAVGSNCYISGNVISHNNNSFSNGLRAGSNSVITDNVVSNNHDCNIECGTDAQSPDVRGCLIQGNTANGSIENGGIRADDSTLINNVASNNGVAGLSAGNPGIMCSNCTLIGNVANDNLGVGFADASGVSGYSNNQFNNNNGGNANPQVSGGIEMGINICGADTACP